MTDQTDARRPDATQQSQLRKVAGFIIPVILLSMSSFASILLAKTDIMKDIVLKKLVISNTSDFYDMWLRSPVQPLLKVYIFNYTNLDAVWSGEDKKLQVQELGPYTYSESTEKVNVVFNNDGTVTYKENRTYVFHPELSSGTEEDMIVSPKITRLSAASMLEDMNFVMQMMAIMVLQPTSNFLTQKVHDFLWVGDNELLTLGAKLLEGKPFDDFGIFSMRAGMSRHSITVHTGTDDENQLNMVSRVDELTSLEAWSSSECDRIDGTTGTLFPPSAVSPDQPLYVFAPELCRRLPLTFHSRVQTRNGIPALRYETASDMFETPDHNPDNACFCREDNTTCKQAGVFDISPCVLGAPVMLSFPHFYQGDPSLTRVVDGLRPNASRHHTFVDVHETLGIPLAGKSRFQVNVAVRKVVDPLSLHEFQDGDIIPILWFELGVAELPDDLDRLVYNVTFSLRRVQLLLIAAALVVAAASATCLLQRVLGLTARRRHNIDTASRKKLLGSSSVKRPA